MHACVYCTVWPSTLLLYCCCITAVPQVRIEDMRRSLMLGGTLASGASSSQQRSDQIQLAELLGEGTFGKVFKGGRGCGRVCVCAVRLDVCVCVSV